MPSMVWKPQYWLPAVVAGVPQLPANVEVGSVESSGAKQVPCCDATTIWDCVGLGKLKWAAALNASLPSSSMVIPFDKLFARRLVSTHVPASIEELIVTGWPLVSPYCFTIPDQKSPLPVKPSPV